MKKIIFLALVALLGIHTVDAQAEEELVLQNR